MAINRTDAGLQQLINMFGDCVKIEKLWTNASPASAFAAQSLTISGLSDYQMIVVITINATESTYQRLSANVVLNTSAYNPMLTYGGFANSTTMAYRAASTSRYMVISNNTIEFGVASRTVVSSGAFSTYTDNQMCKPYQIYGVKI